MAVMEIERGITRERRGAAAEESNTRTHMHSSRRSTATTNRFDYTIVFEWNEKGNHAHHR